MEPLFYPLDVSNRGSIERLSTFLQDKYGGLDILVNNAGIMLRRNQVTFVHRAHCAMFFFFLLKVKSKIVPKRVACMCLKK